MPFSARWWAIPLVTSCPPRSTLSVACGSANPSKIGTALVMPPPLAKAIEASLHAEVKERPRDATMMQNTELYYNTEFGEWCEAANLIHGVEVRAAAIVGPDQFCLSS